MIEQTDRKLQEWVTSVVGGVEVRLGPPREQPGTAVSLYLLELRSALPTQRGERRPLELSLRYLVTTSADDELEAHALLGKLVLAALERTDAQVELGSPSPETWAALRIAPRPCFFLELPLVVQRPTKVGWIRRPADIHISTARSFSGVLLTRDDVPVANARVELGEIAATTETDAQGRFSFGAVPEEPRSKRLKITARGVECTVTAQQVAGTPLVIRFDRKEA